MTPCNKTCTIGPDGYCVGCKRTLQEITQWHYMNDTDRQAIMETLKNRGPSNEQDG